MTYGNPFDRLGRAARDSAELIVDRHRPAGERSRHQMRREIVSIGMTRDEAERQVDLVISTIV